MWQEVHGALRAERGAGRGRVVTVHLAPGVRFGTAAGGSMALLYRLGWHVGIPLAPAAVRGVGPNRMTAKGRDQSLMTSPDPASAVLLKLRELEQRIASLEAGGRREEQLEIDLQVLESAEEGRRSAERGREEAEQSRAASDEIRTSEELLRVVAENTRDDADELRLIAEHARAVAEEARRMAEEARDQAEIRRQEAQSLTRRLLEAETSMEEMRSLLRVATRSRGRPRE